MKNKSIIEKYKGMSFADASEKISKKYPQRDYNLLQKKAFEEEVKLLMQHQEEVKRKEELAQVFKNGGKLKKKYDVGGPLSVDALQMLAKQVEQQKALALAQGQKLAAGQIGQNVDYNASGTQISVPDTLPILNSNVSSQQVPSNPFVSTPALVSGTDDMVGPDPYRVPANDKVSTTKDAPTEPVGRSAYTPALLGQGLSTAINLGILAGGYDKEEPVMNPYESESLRNLQERKIDTTQQRNQILSAYNAARENIKNVRSANVRQAMEQNLSNITQDNLAQSKLAEQSQNLQFKGDLANALNNFGQQKVQSQVLADELNARNKGQFLSNLSAFGASTAESSKFFTEKNLNTINNDMLLNILNQKYSTFGIDKSFSDRLSKGLTTPEDFVTLKNAVGEEAAKNIIERFKLKTD